MLEASTLARAEQRNNPARSRPLRLAVLPDFREENWPSMDLCADMLVGRLQSDWHESIQAEIVRPPYRKRLEALPGIRGRSWAFNGDRFLNRHWDFPRHAGRQLADFDAFHICDHSYAHLALNLPAERTGVFCYDLDAFRCLLTPDVEPRPFWFRWMMRRVLRGLRRAAVIFYATQPIKEALLRHGLATERQLVHAPLGRACEFAAEPKADAVADEILRVLQRNPYLLHVGSCIPRKRIEFLLQVFAAVRSTLPNIRLLKVGGEWTADQRGLIAELNLRDAVVHAEGIERSTLAVLYRQAALTLLPSDAEGFGLPIVEALACGCPVLASDLAVLREVGGEAVAYAPVGDLKAWRDRAVRLLSDPESGPRRSARLEQAQRFTWENHAGIIAETYRGLLG